MICFDCALSFSRKLRIDGLIFEKDTSKIFANLVKFNLSLCDFSLSVVLIEACSCKLYLPTLTGM